MNYSDNPTIPVNTDGLSIKRSEIYEFASLLLSYQRTEEELVKAEAAVASLERRIKTTGNTAQRHFTLVETMAIKEAEDETKAAKVVLEQAQVAHKEAHTALDQWIPSSLKPFLKSGGSITALNPNNPTGFIGVTKPATKFIVLTGQNEADLRTEVV